jgi:hypothetical protein
MISSMEECNVDTTGLNMGYYHIKLDADKERINYLLKFSFFKKWKIKRQSFNSKFNHHLFKLGMVSARLAIPCITLNVCPFQNFFNKKLDLITVGYWITWQDIKIVDKKKKFILRIRVPKLEKVASLH